MMMARTKLLSIIYRFSSNKSGWVCHFPSRINSKRNMCSSSKILNFETMNPNFKNVEYAVRGKIVQLAAELEEDLRNNKSLPFKRVIRANIGDCHAVGQHPITYFRQVLSGVSYPELLKSQLYPNDVKEKCKEIIKSTRFGIGCYSDSVGIGYIRKKISEFIQSRDGGIHSDPNSIIVANGASAAIKLVLSSMMTGRRGSQRAGIMSPVPMYPLYSAIVSEYDGHLIGYYLEESNGWSLNIDELERAYESSVTLCQPRAMVVINPGNPTGQLLSKSNMQAIVEFCHKKRLILLADEVYQENIHTDSKGFVSFKKVIHEMGDEYSDMELASFHSISKGYYGECGLRGGYVELHGFDPRVMEYLVKLQSTQLCSSTAGQIVLCCVVDPPVQGMESFSKFQEEKSSICKELKKKANLVHQKLNEIPGIKCNKIEGALYAFPQITIPEKAIAIAKEMAMEPDMYYCIKLLRETGICFVPGSGFGQVPGTYHFRTTILPSVEDMVFIMEKVKAFHLKFSNDHQ